MLIRLICRISYSFSLIWCNRVTALTMNDMDLLWLTKRTLERGYLMSLAVNDADGIWVADVIYIHDDDLNIYWMSRTNRRHSQAIDGGSDRVAATITVTHGPQDPDEGLQISGRGKQLTEPPLDLLKTWMAKKRKQDQYDAAQIVLDEHVWYQLIPDKIELINQEQFGYDRQTVLSYE